ncbi:translation initiation factor IF-2, mitochondrial isoform X2 [Cephus cinctus]|uniref:Translation initiation factor IF-2, mitochondrial n=1 Tax=Cephus cinctus TaxID=211228 RepID=A0AAJ7FES6_CEPCN|nr:translation initiation factor IF-2, mitochondrial isoform X2 [Cephus cinctus]
MNMAASVVKIFLKHRWIYSTYTIHSTTLSSTRRILGEIKNIKNSFLPVCCCIQCHSYGTTPIFLKQRKVNQEREQEQHNPLALKLKKKNTLVVDIWKNMTVSDIANVMQRDIADVFEALSLSDQFFHYKKNKPIENSAVIQETVKKLGAKFKIVSHPTRKDDKKQQEDMDVDAVKRTEAKSHLLIKRHPVVTVMGHVDHGKTTLLDSIRNTSVVKSEFGGITQHIGAFNVTLNTGERMTFLDTPGHAAFSAMRARGASATDIVVLVVAADDGVMDQTVQSIEMAKEANVPVIVAINKIDKPEADIERTQQMLAQHGILVEDLGGDIQSINISALKGTNLTNLTEAIAAQAEVMELKGDPTGLVEGIVIESTNHPGRGKLSTALIQRGTLRRGAVLVSGLAWAKVRSMFDDSGKLVNEAKLAEAVQIIGWRVLPSAGDEIIEVENEKRAHQVLRYREARLSHQKSLEQQEAADKKHQDYLTEYKTLLEKRRAMGRRKLKREGPREKEIKDDNVPKVNVVIKGDVDGSVEAILDVLETYTNGNDKCRLNVIHYGVGPVCETDVELAETFDAIIYNFNVNAPKTIEDLARKCGVQIRPHNVIYKLVDDLKTEINNKLPMTTAEELLGEANVLQEFQVSEGRKKIPVAGCRCTKGVLKKSEMFRLMRENEIIYTGKLKSMRHLKNEVDSIKKGVECGLRLDDPTVLFKPGDTLLCFRIYEKKQETDWDPGF